MSRALVISSSGVRLVYEIAVLHGITNRVKDPKELQWTHVYGTSGGALLASFLCMYNIGEEKAAIDYMKQIFLKNLGENGLRCWIPCCFLQGFFCHSGLYDPSFVEQLIDRHIDPERIAKSNRQLHIVALDYGHNRSVEYTNKDWRIIKKAIMASASIPGVYPPYPVETPNSPTGVSYFGDGGITEYIPLDRALCNDNITQIDAILSVGPRETRSIEMPIIGQRPSILKIINTILDANYNNIFERTTNLINLVNLLVHIGDKKPSKMPDGAWKGIQKLKQKFKRTNYVNVKIFHPSTPISFSTTGTSDKVGVELWKAGEDAVNTVFADGPLPSHMMYV